MNPIELEEVFGAEVLVQFREPMAVVKPGKTQRYTPVTAIGTPQLVSGPAGQLGAAAREQVVPVKDGELTFYVTGRIAPAEGGRVTVAYPCSELDHIAIMLVRPSDIVAVTIVQQNPSGQRLIATP